MGINKIERFARLFKEMKGHSYEGGCAYKKKKKCICSSKCAYTVDIGVDPVTGKSKQKTKSGFKTWQKVETAATAFIHELN